MAIVNYDLGVSRVHKKYTVDFSILKKFSIY